MTTHPIPAAALAQHLAILGKTGSGKTYAAKGVVERLLRSKERVCIIDPTGVYWGLRLLSDGKTPSGLDVVIFGGRKGDLPLGAEHGERIAEIVGGSTTPVILDTSDMSVAGRMQMFTAFANNLLRTNHGPLHLILDEAHLFAPQGRTDPQGGMLVHATNNLVSLGRSRGLRIILITQRPAKLHKDSLTQVETLVAMRLVAPQDRKAVEGWIADQADKQRGTEIIASLPKLRLGEGWVWSPEIDALNRAMFPRIATFDSGASPDATGRGPKLAPLNVEAIRKALTAPLPDSAADKPSKPGSRAERITAEERGYQRGLADGKRAGILLGIEQARRSLAEFQRSLSVASRDTSGDASRDVPLSNAERARRYREKKRRNASRSRNVTKRRLPQAQKRSRSNV